MDIRTLVYMWTSLLLSIFSHSPIAHGYWGHSHQVFFHTITLYLSLFSWWGLHLDPTSESRRCNNMYLKYSWTEFSRQLQNKDAINDSTSCQPLCIPEMIGHVVQRKGCQFEETKISKPKKCLSAVRGGNSAKTLHLRLLSLSQRKKQTFFPFFPVYKQEWAPCINTSGQQWSRSPQPCLPGRNRRCRSRVDLLNAKCSHSVILSF